MPLEWKPRAFILCKRRQEDLLHGLKGLPPTSQKCVSARSGVAFMTMTPRLKHCHCVDHAWRGHSILGNPKERFDTVFSLGVIPINKCPPFSSLGVAGRGKPPPKIADIGHSILREPNGGDI